ncbi:MAG: Hsp70 family protein [Pseudanabaenaceae cyanobacterium]
MAIVAIDFGTSNTVVAVRAQGQDSIWHFPALTRTFSTGQGPVGVVPSLAYKLPRGGGWLWGEQVRLLGAEAKSSPRYWHSFKRELVATAQSPDRRLDGEIFNSGIVAELFMERLITGIELAVEQVVFTAPVGAFNSYLQWFRHFTKKLFPQLSVLLVDESTAAALGYALSKPYQIIMVIDFGGGTLDISIVRTLEIVAEQRALEAEVIAKADAYIGGVDIDQWIAEYWQGDPSDAQGWLELLQTAEQAKMGLPVAGYSLSRSELTDILERRGLLDQLRQTIDEALESALRRGISKSAIEQVLLVGGSCLLSPVQELVCAYFGKQRVHLDQPFTAVARGGLVLGSQAWVQDYLHHSYGIRLWEPFVKQYQFYPLFGRGTQYPTQLAEPVILQVANDGQTQVVLDIGEVADSAQAEITYDSAGKMTSAQLLKHSDFQTLQTLTLNLDPPGELGTDRLALHLRIASDRTLILSVTDLLTGAVLLEDYSVYRLN